MSRTLVLFTTCLLLVLTTVAAAASNKGTNQKTWADNALTTMLWKTISSGDVDQLRDILEINTDAPHARSSDGRGPLWWAYEYGQKDMVEMLIAAGANPNEKDGDGKTPKEVTVIGATEYAQSNDYDQTQFGDEFDPNAFDIPDDEDE